MNQSLNIFLSESTLLLFVFGALGALVKDIVLDNKLVLPKLCNGEISLGFVGGVLSGAMIGYLVDNNLTTAFFSGYAGTAIFEQLLSKHTFSPSPEQPAISDTITSIAREAGTDPSLALRVAKCESALNPQAINTNTDGSRDRGLFQWNDKYHPEVTDDMAFDPIMATKLFCKAERAGNLSWWNASRKCWNK